MGWYVNLIMTKTVLPPIHFFAISVKHYYRCQHTDYAGGYRYFRIQKALTTGRFPPARKSMALISGLLISIVIIVFGVLVGVKQV